LDISHEAVRMAEVCPEYPGMNSFAVSLKIKRVVEYLLCAYLNLELVICRKEL
jgi:hypothetical protein